MPVEYFSWLAGLLTTLGFGQAPQWGAPKWRVNLPLQAASASKSSSGSGSLYSGNADISFTIPFINKPERGIPFFLGLTYNSDIYQNNGYEFQPVGGGAFNGKQLGAGSWGWMVDTPGGSMVNDTYIETCYYYVGRIRYPAIYDLYNNYRFYGPHGTMHPFSLSFSTSNQCHSGNMSGSGYSTDGEGYYYNTSTGLFGPDGVNYAPQVSGGLVEDTNGNYISETSSTNETDYYDETGTEVAKIIAEPNGCVSPVDGLSYPKCTEFEILSPNSSNYETYLEVLTTQAAGSNSNCGIGDYSGTATVPVYLVMPQYTSGSNWYYKFEYNDPASRGFLTSVQWPTGGTTTFSYGSLCTFEDGGPASVSETDNDANGNQGTTTYTRSSGTMTVNYPDSSKEIITYDSHGLPTDVQYYDTDGSTLLKEIQFTTNDPYPLSAITYLNGYKISETSQTFNSNGQLTQEIDTDWARDPTGSTQRITNISYLSGTAYANANIIDRPTQIEVTNGSGTLRSETNITYDSYSSPSELLPSSGAGNHDSTYNNTYTTRGNPTEIEQMTSSASGLTTVYGYEDTGNIVQATDPNGNKINTAYGNCADSYVSSQSVPGGSEILGYDCSRGDLTSMEGPNNNSTALSFDAYGNLSEVMDPDGGSTTLSYPDPNDTESVTATSPSGPSITAYDVTDGFGRTIYQQTASPTGYYDTVETEYNSTGEVAAISNPYNTGHPATAGTQFTQYAYDGLGRAKTITAVDGSTTHYTWQGHAAAARGRVRGLERLQHIVIVCGYLQCVPAKAFSRHFVGGIETDIPQINGRIGAILNLI